MNVHDLLKYSVTFTHGITKAYVADITDDEMLVRAVPGSNHVAWQLGHLIASEHSLLTAVGGAMPDLPDGFAEKHGKDNIHSDDPKDFLSKKAYLGLMQKMHDAALAVIDGVDEAGLDAPAPESLRGFFPTVGSVLFMAGGHEMMHAGQIAAIRRKLGKPIAI
ncbi:MAG: DinB family protein [Phycisphaerales bacterium]|nr:DinB family protein [Phycisphaerales bacterium]